MCVPDWVLIAISLGATNRGHTVQVLVQDMDSALVAFSTTPVDVSVELPIEPQLGNRT